MRIYYGIIIGFIVICCLSFSTKYLASTWAGTANNETLSRSALANAIATGVFYQKASFTGTTRQITKAEAAAWVFLNESASPFAGKASNQLVIKTDLVAPTIPPPLYYSSSPDNACSTGLLLTGVVYNSGATNFCFATTIQADQFISEIAGASIFVSNGYNVREAVINNPNVSGIATFVGSCGVCTGK